jgi:hypothetical protein
VPHDFHSNRTGLEKFRHAAHEIVKSVKTASSDVQTMTHHLQYVQTTTNHLQSDTDTPSTMIYLPWTRRITVCWCGWCMEVELSLSCNIFVLLPGKTRNQWQLPVNRLHHLFKWQYMNGIQWHKKITKHELSASDFHSQGM